MFMVNKKTKYLESEFKGPLEYYSEMLKKNESYSIKHNELNDRRNHIEYEELEYKMKLKLKLDQKINKVQKFQKLLEQK